MDHSFEVESALSNIAISVVNTKIYRGGENNGEDLPRSISDDCSESMSSGGNAQERP